MAESELTRATRLAAHIQSILTALDVDLIGRETAKTIAHIKRLSADIRLDVRDWEMADSRAEMTRHAAAAQKRLEDLRRSVLQASEHGIFGAVDVVQISADIDEITARVA